MRKLKAHFDGKVIVPDEPVDLPRDCELEVQVQPKAQSAKGAGSLQRLLDLARQFPAGEHTPQDLAQQHDKNGSAERPLEKLLKALDQLEPNPDWPADGAAQHDHYLYGTPKRT